MTIPEGPVALVTRALAVLAERRPEWYRLLRFGAVSAVVTPVTLMILWGLHALADWPPWQANAVAVSAGAVPAYVLNRYWVWHRTGRNRLWGEVLPFWALALLGGAASTAAVEAAGRWDNSGLLVLVNLGTYGVLWLLKFAVLDRFVWPAARSQRAKDPRQPAAVQGA